MNERVFLEEISQTKLIVKLNISLFSFKSILQKFDSYKKIHVTDIAIQIFPMHPVRC